MTNATQTKAPKERSRSFPALPLKASIERLQQFEAKFGRHPAPYEKAGLAWGMEEGSSQANRYLAALKSFGLLDYNGSGKDRTVAISESGRTYLRAQQDSIKKDILKVAALKPKQIAYFWPLWGTDRPVKEVCLDELVFKHGFTGASAPQFLKVYDETIAYAGLAPSDKASLQVDDDDEENDPLQEPESTNDGSRRDPVVTKKSLKSGVKEDVFTLDEGEVVLQWPERLSKASFEDLEGWMQIQLRKIKRHVTDGGSSN